MSIRKLKDLLYHPQSVRHITNNVIQMNPHNYMLFDHIQKKKNGYVYSNSWVGANHCGDTSYVTKKFLVKNNYNNIKVVSNNRIRGSNHCFLMINNIIIDTTYKQFLLDHRMNENCDYRKYLFNLPPFFIGTDIMLEEMLVNLIDKNLDVYEISFLNKKNLLKYWDVQLELYWD